MADERPDAQLRQLFDILGVRGTEGVGNAQSRVQTALTIMRSTAFICISKDARIVAYDAHFCELFGLPGDWIGQPVQSAFTLLPALSVLLSRTIEGSRGFGSRLICFERELQPTYVLVDAQAPGDRGLPNDWIFTFKQIDDMVAFDTQKTRNDKLSTIAKVAAGVSHEISNPLTSVKGFLQMMQQGFLDSAVTREQMYTDLMMAEIERMNRLTDGLLMLARPGEISEVHLRVDVLALQLLQSIKEEADMARVCIRPLLMPMPEVVADEKQLTHALHSLVKNALEAMEDGGVLTVKTEYDLLEERIRVDISDTGQGIPHYMTDRIFDVFYTTKQNNLGLGLPITQRIITDLGGEIHVFSKGHGTTFSVLLPPARRG